MVKAAGGRDVVEFGTRRAHTPEAGTLGARAAYIGGCAGTSNTLAGYRYGIPIFGTAAHSWVLSFSGEKEAFRQLQKLLGDYTVQLVDTYDTLQGARRAIELGKPLWGVRLDSGDVALLARDVRGMLDEAGLRDAKIMASGDLDENKIAKLIAGGAPIDSFGVGTELATSADAPSMGAVYKLVEIDVHGITRYTAKKSLDKNTLPGAKQIFRFADHDVIGRCGDCVPGDCVALQQPVMFGGHALPGLPDVHQARKRAVESLAAMRPGHRVEYTPDLQDLIERTGRRPV
jgi:nicotinate phosphoribosyltransferase